MTQEDDIGGYLQSLPKSKYRFALTAINAINNGEDGNLPKLAGGLHAIYFLVSRVSASSISPAKPV